MATTLQARLGELAADETEALLRERHVGRVAYGWGDHVDIEPIPYVYDRGAIYGRTSPGAKLLTLRHGPEVAFEVGDASGPSDWRSVVAHGPVAVLTADGTAAERRAHARALALLRTIDPAALTGDDPAPWRRVLFRIAVERVTGRESRPG